MAVEEARDAGRLGASSAAGGRDGKPGNGLRCGCDAAPVAVAIVVMDGAEMETAGRGEPEGGRRRIPRFVVPVRRVRDVDELKRTLEPGEGDVRDLDCVGEVGRGN